MIIRVLILIVTFFSLFVFARDLETKKITLQLQWKHQFEFAGFYMAKELGYYERIGLDVDFIEYDGTYDIVEKVEKNEVDFALGGSSIISNWQNGAEIFLLAEYFKKAPLALVTRPEIKSPADLVGKKIMISKNDLNSAHYAQMFKSFNITEQNTDFLTPEFDFKSFDDLGIDAYSVFLTNEPYRLLENGVSFNVITPSSYGISFNDVNLYTSYKFAENRPLLIKNFVEASNKGWEYALNNIDKAVDVILKKYNSQNKTKNALIYEARESLKYIMPKSYEIGSVSLDKIKEISIFFYEMGLTKKSNDIEDFYYFSEKNNFLSSDERLYLKDKRSKLKVCIDPAWMPFEKLENGKHVGISADILDRVSKELDVIFELVKTDTWMQSLDYAKKRKCDIFPMAMKTQDRSKYMNFTDPYIKSPYVLATTNKQLYVDNIADIIDEEIAIVKGYAYSEIIKKQFPNKRFIEVDSVKEGLKLLSEEKIYGFLDALITIAYEVSKEQYFNIKISGTFDNDWSMSIASRNDEPVLNSILNKALKKISDEERKEIFNKWFKLRVDKKVDNTLLLQIIFVFIIILFFIMMWSITLHKEKKLTKKSLMEIQKLKSELEAKNLELLQQSVTDQLTSLYNRRKLDEVILNELNRFERTKKEFVLIIVDLDYFKSVNDNYGHNVGDKVLIEIAKILESNIRKTDIVGRWGGEEFMIFAPNTNLENGIVIAQKLRKAIEAYEFDTVGAKTASFGVTVSMSGDDKDTITQRADKALYEAKNMGRNRVVSYI